MSSLINELKQIACRLTSSSQSLEPYAGANAETGAEGKTYNHSIDIPSHPEESPTPIFRSNSLSAPETGKKSSRSIRKKKVSCVVDLTDFSGKRSQHTHTLIGTSAHNVDSKGGAKAQNATTTNNGDVNNSAIHQYNSSDTTVLRAYNFRQRELMAVAPKGTRNAFINEVNKATEEMRTLRRNSWRYARRTICNRNDTFITNTVSQTSSLEQNPVRPEDYKLSVPIKDNKTRQSSETFLQSSKRPEEDTRRDDSINSQLSSAVMTTPKDRGTKNPAPVVDAGKENRPDLEQKNLDSVKCVLQIVMNEKLDQLNNCNSNISIKNKFSKRYYGASELLSTVSQANVSAEKSMTSSEMMRDAKRFQIIKEEKPCFDDEDMNMQNSKNTNATFSDNAADQYGQNSEYVYVEPPVKHNQKYKTKKGISVHDGVRTIMIYRHSDPQAFSDLETYGHWGYEPIAIFPMDHLKKQYNTYKKLFQISSDERLKTNLQKKKDLGGVSFLSLSSSTYLSPKEIDAVCMDLLLKQNELTLQRQQHKELKKKKTNTTITSATTLESKVAAYKKKKRTLKTLIANLRETLFNAGVLSSGAPQSVLTEDFNSSSEAFIIPCFPFGGGITGEQNMQLMTTYKGFIKDAAKEEQCYAQDLNNLSKKFNENQKKKCPQQQQQQKDALTILKALSNCQMIPYLTKVGFEQCCFPEDPSSTNTDAWELNIDVNFTGPRIPFTNWPWYVSTFPKNIAQVVLSGISPSALRTARAITAHQPMTILIDREIVFDATKAKQRRRAQLIHFAKMQQHHHQTPTDLEKEKISDRALMAESRGDNWSSRWLLEVDETVAHPPKVALSRFPLTVIMDPYRTGFEEDKELPLRLPRPPSHASSSDNVSGTNKNKKSKKNNKNKNADFFQGIDGAWDEQNNSSVNGMIIAGRYQLLDILGQATFSRAVRCIDLQQRYEYDSVKRDYIVVKLNSPDPPLNLFLEKGLDGDGKGTRGTQNDDGAESYDDNDVNDQLFNSSDSDYSSSEDDDDMGNDKKVPFNKRTREVGNGHGHSNKTLSSRHSPEEYLQVCLKIINNTKEFFDQSLDEIRLLHLLNTQGDPDDLHFVRMIEFFYYKEHTIIVTELLSDNLYEYSKYCLETQPTRYFTIARVRRIARQVLTALKYVHSLNLIHSDLKPENILFVSHKKCTVKVIDFGSSCFVSDHLSSYVQSRSYRAPEVILGANYDGRIDVWSLGAILVELITNEVLFESETSSEMLARIVAVCGRTFPRRLLYEGRTSSQFFTRFGCIFETSENRNSNGKNNFSKEQVQDCYYLYAPVHELITQQRVKSSIPKKKVLMKISCMASNDTKQDDDSTNCGVMAGVVVPFSRLHQKLDSYGVFPGSDCMNFIEKCLEIDYTKRWTSSQLLEHPFILTLDVDAETILA